MKIKNEGERKKEGEKTFQRDQKEGLDKIPVIGPIFNS